MRDERKRTGWGFPLLTGLILAISPFLSLFSACTSNDRPDKGSVTETGRNEASQENPPVRSIVDAYGDTIELREKNPRFISLAPNLTETVYALGGEERLLARTDYCDYPPEAKEIESVGTLGSYNFERIVALDPDVILMMTFDGSSRREYNRLKELGLRPVAFAEGDLESVIRTIDSVGSVIGRSEQGSALTGKLLGDLDSLRDLNRGREPVPIFVVIDQAPLMTVSGGFITSMVEAAGGRNVAAGNPVPYPRYSREALLTDRPEVILIPGLDPDAPARFLERYPEAAATPAGRHGRILTIDPNLLARPGPRVIEGVKVIRRIGISR